MKSTESPAAGSSIGRLLGLKRGGPRPAELEPGQPLRPFTWPNLLSYIRLALIPLFLVLAFSTGDGRSTATVIVFGVAALSDYFDGMLARALNQYSRFGSYLDPAVDRILVLAAGAVAWYFNMLPRWAIAVLFAREILILLLSRLALKYKIDIKINWPGRISLWLILMSVGLTLIVDSELARAMFVAGVALMVVATAIYLVEGYREIKGIRQASQNRVE